MLLEATVHFESHRYELFEVILVDLFGIYAPGPFASHTAFQNASLQFVPRKGAPRQSVMVFNFKTLC